MKKYLTFLLLVLFICQTAPAALAEDKPAERNNEMAFSIPANTFCDQSQKVELSLNLTNMGNTNATVKLDLIKGDGTQYVAPGTTYNGINSTITPGTSISISPLLSAYYHQTFGGINEKCTDRPYAGKITVTSGEKATIVASGFISGSLGNSTIIINGGQPWNVSGVTPTTPTGPINPPVDSCSIEENNGLVHAMTSNEDVYGIASASSYETGYNSKPFHAFDNSCVPWSTAGGQTTGWLQYEFKSAKTVTEYTIKMKQNDPSWAFLQSPKSWVFEAYDGQKWVTLDTQTNVTNWTPAVTNKYQINNTVAYNKYRLNFSGNNGGNVICISEVGLLGY
ncbi:discoidin domain-containing protein [Paenibacillus ehimensis]|uniref:discoidin domain-containing protein n=1 Tax=Paenibacillus ehimensis TaxID=79264 RepID=UPI002DBF705D|nr:discoidin domain-containing protein [Paenibacillus ehimensis]MEC0207551.1 discoidin domain-containing protein [Paenibacillus ehimensis]